MYEISKEFSFCASHNLNDLHVDHPCARTHGHNYKVIFTLRSETLNQPGFVLDYRDLDFIKNFINNGFDHKHLNDFLDFNPTSENLAAHFYKMVKVRLKDLWAVTVKETDKTSATYYGSN